MMFCILYFEMFIVRWCSGAQAAGRAGGVRRAGGRGGARGGGARQAARRAPAQPLLRLPLRAAPVQASL